jgi:hypothetical protein
MRKNMRPTRCFFLFFKISLVCFGFDIWALRCLGRCGALYINENAGRDVGGGRAKKRRFGSGIVPALVYQIFSDEASHRFTEKEKTN